MSVPAWPFRGYLYCKILYIHSYFSAESDIRLPIGPSQNSQSFCFLPVYSDYSQMKWFASDGTVYLMRTDSLWAHKHMQAFSPSFCGNNKNNKFSKIFSSVSLESNPFPASKESWSRDTSDICF